MGTAGRRIREIRRRLGLTQIEFADRLKTTQSSVSRWESEDQTPDIPVLMKIGELAGLDPIKFAFYDEEHPYGSYYPGDEVTVLAAIQWDHWSESLEWEEHDRFLVGIPRLRAWRSLVIFGFVVRDDSADLLYPKDSIVFGAIIPGKVTPPSPLCDEFKKAASGEWPYRKLQEVSPRHDDIVIVRRKSAGGLVELTLRRYHVNSDEEHYLVPVSSNPKFASYRTPPKPAAGETVTDYEAEIIGIVVCSFRMDASAERFAESE
jgi:transcriptional regulator with XRE-family HTH domain